MPIDTSEARTSPSLAPEHVAQFQRDGYIRIPRLFDPDCLETVCRAAVRMAVRYHATGGASDRRADWAAPRLRVANSWLRADALRQIVFRRDLAEMAGKLLSARSVQLFADMIVLKEPSCPEMAWHCDSAYIPVDPEAIVTLWFPLSDMSTEQGAVMIRPGSHLWEGGAGFRPDRPLSVRRTHRGLDRAQFPIHAESFAQGDAVFYAGRTFHRGGANRTSAASCAMFIIYMRGDEPLRRPVNDMQDEERRASMAGIAVGKPIHTPLHPLLWRE